MAGDPAAEYDATRRTSAQQVATYIRRMIFKNELRSGNRIPQEEIATRLRVSRVPVREALIALDREGWVTNEAHRGAFVNVFNESTVLDHFEFLGMLYGFAARRTTERGTPAELKELVELSREFRAETDPTRLWELNHAFLDLVVRASHSSRIASMARLLGVNIMPGVYFADIPGADREHKKGVRAIVRCIREGDGAAAEQAFITMTRMEARSAVEVLRARRYFGT